MANTFTYIANRYLKGLDTFYQTPADLYTILFELEDITDQSRKMFSDKIRQLTQLLEKMMLTPDRRFTLFEIQHIQELLTECDVEEKIERAREGAPRDHHGLDEKLRNINRRIEAESLLDGRPQWGSSTSTTTTISTTSTTTTTSTMTKMAAWTPPLTTASMDFDEHDSININTNISNTDLMQDLLPGIKEYAGSTMSWAGFTDKYRVLIGDYYQTPEQLYGPIMNDIDRLSDMVKELHARQLSQLGDELTSLMKYPTMFIDNANRGRLRDIINGVYRTGPKTNAYQEHVDDLTRGRKIIKYNDGWKKASDYVKKHYADDWKTSADIAENYNGESSPQERVEREMEKIPRDHAWAEQVIRLGRHLSSDCMSSAINGEIATYLELAPLLFEPGDIIDKTHVGIMALFSTFGWNLERGGFPGEFKEREKLYIGLRCIVDGVIAVI